MTNNEGHQPSAAHLSWIHRLVGGTSDRTLLLLHGTGGNELQLLPLGREIDPQANLLSVRGRSLDEGAPRFFRRFTATKYDQPHLLGEADALAEFSRDAAELYSLNPAGIIPVGFSNGANIALASLARHPQAYAAAVLIRPVMPMEEPPQADLNGLPVLVLHGARDIFLPMAESITPYLTGCGAKVTEYRLNAGHEMTDEDVKLMTEWLNSLKDNA